MKRLCRSRLPFAAILLLCGCAELAPERPEVPASPPRDEITHVIDYSE